jgi:MFS family permease
MERYNEQIRRDFKRNYWANIVEGGIYIGGTAFLSAEAVLPAIVKNMGGGDLLIAFMPVMLRLGFQLPPLFTAHYVEGLRRMKPFVVVASFFQRLPYPICAVLLFWYADDWPRLVLAAVVLTPFISGLFGGLSMGAWMEMVTRVIPRGKRASMWAMRSAIVAIIGFAAGKAVTVILQAYPGTKGYGILHVCVTVMIFVSYVFFLMIREPKMPVELVKPENPSLGKNLRTLPRLLVEDHRYRDFLLSRVTGLSVYLVIPFLAIFACNTTDSPDSFTGNLLAAMMVGTAIGTLIGAYFGDRHGGRILLILARVIFIAGFVFTLFTQSRLVFQFVFAMLGCASNLDLSGANTLGAEIFPRNRRPTYFSLQQFIIFVSLCCISLLASRISVWSSYFLIPHWAGFRTSAILAMLGVGVSCIFVLRVPEPRKEHHDD